MNTNHFTNIRFDNIKTNQKIFNALVYAYATQFWSGAWQELLAIRDVNGDIVTQFGAFDNSTHTILLSTAISPDDPDWITKLWQIADDGDLWTDDGRQVEPYWTLLSARNELLKFITPVPSGGFEGTLLLLVNNSNQIIGFTAYTCLPGELGHTIADQRFTVTKLHIPVNANVTTHTTLKSILTARFGKEKNTGIFLDHAVSVNFQGHGFGSQLFDARLEALLKAGADVIVGRTMTNAPAQYNGNYLKRGLAPFASDVNDRKKHIFITSSENITPRR